MFSYQNPFLHPSHQLLIPAATRSTIFPSKVISYLVSAYVHSIHRAKMKPTPKRPTFRTCSFQHLLARTNTIPGPKCLSSDASLLLFSHWISICNRSIMCVSMLKTTMNSFDYSTRERWSMRRREGKDDGVDASSLPRRILANT